MSNADGPEHKTGRKQPSEEPTEPWEYYHPALTLGSRARRSRAAAKGAAEPRREPARTRREHDDRDR